MKGQGNRKKQIDNKKKRIYGVTFLFFGILFFCCLVWLTIYFIGPKMEEAEINAIRNAYVSEGETSEKGTGGDSADIGSGSKDSADAEEYTESSDETEGLVTDSPSPYGVTDRSIEWASLQKEKNKDIYAWITVPGTAIDYPVLQHPEEMDYYLTHNLNGSAGQSGCIYTQLINSKDWSDRNTVLYGHNMRIGTMFAGLHAFEDAKFFEENRYIHIYSEDGRILIYEIFAAYAFSDAHILLTYDFDTDEGYQQYLDIVRESAEKNGHFRQGTELSTKDTIITLSTCVRGIDTQRYLVQGVLAAEREQP